MARPEWTKQQKASICKSDSDVLLTASAGSGKTAVLSERFLNLLVANQHKCNIDSILVMTFTTDAVAEMRKRIGQRLSDYVVSNPIDYHARRQLAMLGSAQICTLDSFSAGLLRDYFYLVDVDPSFDIIDPSEKNLVQSKLLEDILEENYAGQGQIDNGEFYRFVRAYGGKGGDLSVAQQVRSLARFLETVVNYEYWLEHCIVSGHELDMRVGHYREVLAKRFLSSVERAIIHLELSARFIDEVFESVDGYKKLVLPAVESLSELKDLLTDGLGERAYSLLSDKGNLRLFDRMPSPRNIDPQEKGAIVTLIESARKSVLSIINMFHGDSNLKRQIESSNCNMQVIRSIYTELISRYNQFKSGNVLLDYADLNHKVLKVLYKDGSPTVAAYTQRKRYRYILVDEYQDISPLQETLLNAICSDSCDGGNIFMVGDVKQSIYRFRQAAPEIILAKHNSFTPIFDGEHEVNNHTPLGGRIELNRNFRSRREIVNFVNHVFSRTMVSGFGGIDYKKDGMMEYGAQYYDEFDCSYSGSLGKPVELHLIDTSDTATSAIASQDGDGDTSDDEPNETLDTVRQEVILVAGRIKQMVDQAGEFQVYDNESQSTRRVNYRDITVLLRSLKSQASVYAEVFTEFAIPYFLQQDSGLFDSIEVKYLVSLLQLIDNPCQDIPLAAVLRGRYVGLNENQLAEIRTCYPDGYYYHAVLEYMESGPDPAIVTKLQGLFRAIDRWRTLARSGTLAALLRDIYDHTMLTVYFRGLPDGRQRYANLLYLYQTACEFDSFSSQGLGRFLRHLESMSNSGEDYGPARILGANDNVVQIMSVHRSKGLEFPVVFVAGLGKNFNLRDSSNSMIFTSLENGAFAMDLKAGDGLKSWKTLPREILSNQDKLACKYEELRVQYVALTRAREHLILVGSVGLEKTFEKCSQRQFLCSLTQQVPQPLCEVSDLESANCALDWYFLALADHREFIGKYPYLSEDNAVNNGGDFALKIYNCSDIQQKYQLVKGKSQTVDIEGLLVGDSGSMDISEVVRRLQWQYPSQAAVNCPARAGVTELNKNKKAVQDNYEVDRWRLHEDDERVLASDFGRRPSFMDTETIKINAAERGVLTHRFLELVDLAGDLDLAGLQCQLCEMVTKGYFNSEQADSIDLAAIANFFISDSGQRLVLNIENVYREWEFTLAVDASELPLGVKIDRETANDKVVVRGIIDCLFWNGDSYEIMDFKTDDVSGQRLLDRAGDYEFQLKFYSRAVTAITGKKVASCRLYFLKASQEIVFE